ncbi:hypothetical protein [Streptomyces sp. NPDC005760]|uniref:Rv1733c family protein n=1 Tax=Streptomyces sp. NPDC005760 TaxID=3156718 RepID=UPI003404EFBB
MGGNKVTRKRLWRWRNNPLRRHDDVCEAWILVVMWAVVLVGGTIAALVTAHAADEVFAQQRAERHPVRAVLLTDTPQSTSSVRSGSHRALVTVRWTTPGGATRTGQTLVKTGLRTGSAVTVWQDSRGALATEPTGATEASVAAGLFGVAATLALSGLVFGAGSLARWRLDQHRLQQWDREWALVGPGWNQRTG